MNLGEEGYDSIDADKKPRSGQILWIRGLTRLQTQVSGLIEFPMSLLVNFCVSFILRLFCSSFFVELNLFFTQLWRSFLFDGTE